MNNIKINGKLNKINNVEMKSSLNWKWSLEIKFDIREEVNYFDLYLILKSYVWNNIIPCYSISFAKKDIHSTLIICERENINKVKKLNYLDFEEWINWRIYSDKKYNVKSNFYYILLSFEKKIIEEKNVNLNNFLPIYPWKIEWMNFLSINENKIEFLENKLKIAENKIAELENLLKK